MPNDTIAAISTPLGEGGVSAIRISGAAALHIAAQVFKPKNANRQLSDLAGYTAAFGLVFDGDEQLDEAVALVFRAPKSYTGEDTVELSVHGGVYLIKRLLRAVLAAGARLAEAGEFTKRAFLNGKLDLTEAEAVMNLISAGGEQALHIAVQNKGGAVSRRMEAITEQLLYLVSQISVYADFPDDDTVTLSVTDLTTQLEALHTELNQLLCDYDQGRFITGGIDTVIIGSPNAGKSTLMNRLSRANRSIVTEIAGTTRDMIEDTVTVGEYRLRLVDTAGIHTGGDEIEQIGIAAALHRLETADLCLAVFDCTRPPTESDRTILEKIKDKHTILLLNKMDMLPLDSTPLTPAAQPDYMDTYVKTGLPCLMISAKTGAGEDALREKIGEVLGLNRLSPNAAVLGSERQRQKVLQASLALQDALSALQGGMTPDIAGVCMDEALAALTELTGKGVNEAVVNEVFKHFCIGK